MKTKWYVTKRNPSQAHSLKHNWNLYIIGPADIAAATTTTTAATNTSFNFRFTCQVISVIIMVQFSTALQIGLGPPNVTKENLCGVLEQNFLQAGRPSCHPTNSNIALKTEARDWIIAKNATQ